jgi:hypothetical protein
MTAPILLCADDFALTEGVTCGIEELAAAGRLSATSALVTRPRGRQAQERVARLSSMIAVGLHLNFTLGTPLGPMRLAPAGRFPPIGNLIGRALRGDVASDDIAAETTRQIEAFAAVAGRLPDFVDGHQHAHALPRVRGGVLKALHAAYGTTPVLVRDPADRADRIVRRGAAVAKSLTIAALSKGFGKAVHRAGFVTNDSFSGISPFDRNVAFATELARFFAEPGQRHLVMCHPGHPDEELRALDPVVERRADELAALAADETLPSRIWRPAHIGDRPWSTPPC